MVGLTLEAGAPTTLMTPLISYRSCWIPFTWVCRSSSFEGVHQFGWITGDERLNFVHPLRSVRHVIAQPQQRNQWRAAGEHEAEQENGEDRRRAGPSSQQEAHAVQATDGHADGGQLGQCIERAREDVSIFVAPVPARHPIFVVVAQALLIARRPPRVPCARAPVGVPIFAALAATAIRGAGLPPSESSWGDREHRDLQAPQTGRRHSDPMLRAGGNRNRWRASRLRAACGCLATGRCRLSALARHYVIDLAAARRAERPPVFWG